MKKKVLCLVLALMMILVMMPFAAAVEMEKDAAEILYDLGLFKGTGTNADGTPIFDLEKTPTRNQAVIMLVRLLGKEEEALAGDWELPFTDVVKGSTSYYYIGYAYANGLTNGTTATTYSGSNPIRANQYITFVLRSLGYVSGEDFKVSTAWEFSDEIGLTHGEYNAENAGSFLRGDVADVSVQALEEELKGKSETLAEKLVAEEVFTPAQYESATGKKEEEKPQPEVKPEPVAQTAFGDAEFHRLMLSYAPSEMSLDLSRGGDTYVFKNKFIAGELSEKINGMYSVEVTYEYDAAAGMAFVGTRVYATEETDVGRYIELQTFKADGSFHAEKIFLWKYDPEAFTETAFGDKWLHEYLMGLGPTSAALGPNRPESINYWDQYYYTDQFIAGAITAAIEQRYNFVRVEEALESGTNIGGPTDNAGTRVETMEHEVYGRFIEVATFEPDGDFYATAYYLRWRSDRP